MSTTTTEATTATTTGPNLFDRGAVTLPEATRRFGIGRTVLYELMNTGRLPFTRLGNRRLVPVRAVEALLAAGLTTAPARD